MISNGVGGNSSNPAALQMPAYDGLPPEARALIGAYAYPLDCVAMGQVLNGRFHGDVAAWAADAHPRLQMMRDNLIGQRWGDDHPDKGRALKEDWS